MKTNAILAALMLAGACAWGQTADGSLPVPDGRLAQGEYKTVQTMNGITIAGTLSSDKTTLHVAVSAPTQGWVAIGLGSLRMNGAFMVMAFDNAGKPSVFYELGSGHSHAPATASDIRTAVKETAGVTTLEIALPASAYVKAGSLQMIAAFGTKDNIRTMHAGKVAGTLTF
ncbi:MAG TPA: hypothetical protein VMX33_07010 [bacterium]|nr:hypothetical protein [bacterium]